MNDAIITLEHYKNDKNHKNQQISNNVEEFINNSPYKSAFLGIKSKKNFPITTRQL